MMPHVFGYTGYTMSTLYHYYVSIRMFVLGNCSAHHRCNTLHPCIVIGRYSYCHCCCIRLYSIRWIPFRKTTDPSNFDTLFAHCTHCTMQTPECHCRLYTYRRHKPTIPHIQYHLR